MRAGKRISLRKHTAYDLPSEKSFLMSIVERVEPMIIIDRGNVMLPTRSTALTTAAGALHGNTKRIIANTEANDTGFKYSLTEGFLLERRCTPYV